MSNQVNKSEVISRFNSYLQETNIQEAFEQILVDAIDEDLDDEEMKSAVGILIKQIICHFAEHYENLNNCYGDYSDLDQALQTYVAFNKISENLATNLATAINSGAANDDEEEEDVDDQEVVYKPDNFQKADERAAKVRAFLRKLASAGRKSKNLQPFLKDLDVGDQEDLYGNRQKRYRTQNNESSLPQTQIQQNLFDQQSYEKVQAYARWMAANPAQVFGHRIDESSPGKDLQEAWRIRDEAAKKFGQGKPREEWSLLDARLKGKPK